MTPDASELRIRQAYRDAVAGKLNEDGMVAIWAAAVTDELAETRGEMEAMRVGALVEEKLRRPN